MSAKSQVQHFTDIHFRDEKLTVAGNIDTGKDVKMIIDPGIEFDAALTL